MILFFLVWLPLGSELVTAIPIPPMIGSKTFKWCKPKECSYFILYGFHWHSVLIPSSDALALNIGSASWQRTQIQNAYDAAQQLGTGFKLFISFDFTEMGCDLNDIVARVNQFAGHPNQFRYNGKVFISSFAGDCLGNSGWQSLKSQTNGYLMPFIWGLENQFNVWSALDSWYW